MSSIGRREFFRSAAALGSTAAFAPSLSGLVAWNATDASELAERIEKRHGLQQSGGYGQLIKSTTYPEFLIPKDFRLVRISETHIPSIANPEFVVPAAVDGMASFAMPNGNVRLVRNHEVGDEARRATHFGKNPYDAKGPGGTTSLEVKILGRGNDLAVTVVREFASLTGTLINCAGGRTPWGSWLSCEETTNGVTQGYEKPHGYVFEVPAGATEEVDAVPLKAMGRFKHEAVAVDPGTGIVYLTEDFDQPIATASFYRFIPKEPGKLREGGKLQALAIRNAPNYDTSLGQEPGVVLQGRWIDIEEPDPDAAETNVSAVYCEGQAKGAARFQRLEGCFWGDNGVYFDSTSGGDARSGQIWQYRPTSNDRGDLRLVFESPSPVVLDRPDNICLSPRGAVIICEDSGGDQFVRALLKNGEMVNLACAVAEQGKTPPTELAGCCMSPDGRVLFFNQQGTTRSYGQVHGGTYALWGPWERGGL